MKKILTLLIAATLIAAAMMLNSCSQWDPPFKELDKNGNTVTVEYNAGDGVFINTNGITVYDVFNVDDVKNGSGIKLLSPDDKSRGAGNDYPVSCEGHIFGGWYIAKTDNNGKIVPDLSRPWDFSTSRLNSSYLGSGELSSSVPVLTLCARWIPFTSFEIYVQNSKGGFDLKETLKLDAIRLPKWNEKGEMDLGDLSEISGMTFTGAYLNSALTEAIETESYKVEIGDSEENPTVKIYTTWMEGEWFKISTPEQLRSNAKARGCYLITNDIDMTGYLWPSAFTGNFNGKFISEGENTYKISGISGENATSKNSGAIFGNIGKDAEFKNISFESVSYTINGSIRNDAAFALFCVSADEGAEFENVTVKGKLLLSALLTTEFKSYLSTYNIGIASAYGNIDGVDTDEVICEFDTPDEVADGITVSVDTSGSVNIVFPD